jgi:hypothetical protein
MRELLRAFFAKGEIMSEEAYILKTLSERYAEIEKFFKSNLKPGFAVSLPIFIPMNESMEITCVEMMERGEVAEISGTFVPVGRFLEKVIDKSKS